MVDFHTHVLPGMDDGSKNAEQSIAMLEELRKQQVNTVIATPHFDMRTESIERFLERRQNALHKIDHRGEKPELILGAEVLYCGNYLHQIEGIEKLCIGSTQYLLVENFIQEWSDSFRIGMLRLMLEKNIIPIIAHVERYYHIRKNRLMMLELRRQGVILQMNAGQFVRFRTRRRALRLLQSHVVQILGSDCHNMDTQKPDMEVAVQVIQANAGSEALERLNRIAEKILKIHSLSAHESKE